MRRNTLTSGEIYEDDFQAGMGAESIKKLLHDLDLEQLSVELKAQLKDASGQKKGPYPETAGVR